jgi:guanylate cyclase
LGLAQAYRPSEAVDWPGKNKPEAEPGCGFLNEHCPKDDTHMRSIVAAGVLAVLLFCAAVITMSIYRRWKIEQEIEGLLWKIDPSEIHGYPHLDNMMSSPSKVSSSRLSSPLELAGHLAKFKIFFDFRSFLYNPP